MKAEIELQDKQSFAIAGLLDRRVTDTFEKNPTPFMDSTTSANLANPANAGKGAANGAKAAVVPVAKRMLIEDLIESQKPGAQLDTNAVSVSTTGGGGTSAGTMPAGGGPTDPGRR